MRFLATTITAVLATFLPFAIPTASPANQKPLLHHASSNRAVSAHLFSELEELARIVDIAYCVGLTSPGIYQPFTCLSRCSDFPLFELATTWNTGPLLSDSCGYIALDHGKKRIIVAFRGTYSIANTVVDLSTVPQAYEPYPGGEGDSAPKCENCTVHAGFHTSWLNTRARMMSTLQSHLLLAPTYSLHLVGHSLGGAVAALAALDLLSRGHDPIVTTFGEPRVGNQELAHHLDRRFELEAGHEADRVRYRRVTHADDPVPLLPLTEWGYTMHAGEIFISKSALSPDIGDLQLCEGDNDDNCIAGQDSTVGAADASKRKRDLLNSVETEVQDVLNEPWGVPSRYKLWHLFFAHRDYFWRLGLCVPGGDPLGGGKKYEGVEAVDEL